MYRDRIIANGIDGASGEYLLPPLPAVELARVARGETLDKGEAIDLQRRAAEGRGDLLGPREGVDPKRLDEAGWGVVFAADDERAAALEEALAPLLTWRREQAGERYRRLLWPRGCGKNRFLSAHGVEPAAPAVPEKVPYYLLLVGEPEEGIPLSFQLQLDVRYAVGRLYFEHLDDYARYAERLVEAERAARRSHGRATFFAVRNEDDLATEASDRHLVRPLAGYLAGERPAWMVDLRRGKETHKADLTSLLAGGEAPDFLFTASHGMRFPPGDTRQLAHQGALLCSDWPGRASWGARPIPEEHYLSADDLSADIRVDGMISFHFACYGAATPRWDAFAHRAQGERRELAPRSFLARLPARLLTAGARAVVGHVERVWSTSFYWPQGGAQRTVFEDFLKRLFDGHPLGSAMEPFDQKHADLATMLTEEIEQLDYGKSPDEALLASLWTAHNDARNYFIVGDPAARLT